MTSFAKGHIQLLPLSLMEVAVFPTHLKSRQLIQVPTSELGSLTSGTHFWAN